MIYHLPFRCAARDISNIHAVPWWVWPRRWSKCDAPWKREGSTTRRFPRVGGTGAANSVRRCIRHVVRCNYIIHGDAGLVQELDSDACNDGAAIGRSPAVGHGCISRHSAFCRSEFRFSIYPTNTKVLAEGARVGTGHFRACVKSSRRDFATHKDLATCADTSGTMHRDSTEYALISVRRRWKWDEFEVAVPTFRISASWTRAPFLLLCCLSSAMKTHPSLRARSTVAMIHSAAAFLVTPTPSFEKATVR